MDTRLSNPVFLSLKAVLACFLALLLSQLLDNPDLVSSTFIAVLCISPTVLIGLKNAWDQVIGSLIGGVWGVLALVSGISVLFALPMAVGCSIAFSFLFRVSGGYPIAAFTALFMIIVPFGSAGETFQVRFLAIFIAGLSSFLVNALISAMAYPPIFHKRMRIVEAHIFSVLPAVAQGDLARADSGFDMTLHLQQQLVRTLKELKFRRAWKIHAELETLYRRTRSLNYLLHLVWDLACVLQEKELEPDIIHPFIEWLLNPQGESIPLPAPLTELQGRIIRIRENLAETS